MKQNFLLSNHPHSSTKFRFVIYLFLIIHVKMATFITQDTFKMYFYFKIFLHTSVWLIGFPQHVLHTVCIISMCQRYLT